MPPWQQPFFYTKRDVSDNRDTMKKDILIVDGYNVIFDWQDLKSLSKESLEHARLELRHRLLNYGSYKGYKIILVFDGKHAPFTADEQRISGDFIEVFTGTHETADAYIEREVFSKKGQYKTIYVVTSDGEEQSQILGFGGLRISARELRHQIELAKQDERKRYTGQHRRDAMTLQRNELGAHIDGDVAEKLERMRRGEL